MDSGGGIMAEGAVLRAKLAPPADRHPEFSEAEIHDRWARARALMDRVGLGALLVTGEFNYRYLTGHWSGRATFRARPMFLLLPRDGEPCLVITSVEVDQARTATWVADIRYIVEPRGSNDYMGPAVDLLIRAVREQGLGRGRIGCELGIQQRIGMPVEEFRRLAAQLGEAAIVDASALLWELRAVKSAAEVEYLRRSALITSEAYRRCLGAVRPGMTERDLFRSLAVAMLEQGADSLGYIPVNADIRHPVPAGATDRRIAAGAVVHVDAGCIVRGYWSDFSRALAVGEVPIAYRRGYTILRTVMHDCIGTLKPGIPLRSIPAYFKRALEKEGYWEPGIGRMGHGIGLEQPEPPSLDFANGEATTPGMVLCIEPRIVFGDGSRLVLEEEVLITEDGYVLLSEPCAPELPVAGC